MRIVAGLAFFWHIDPAILCSQPLMRLVGFNGRQIREGTSGRGNKSAVAQTGEDSGEMLSSSEIRGPYCPDSIASCVQAIAASALERLFNGVVSLLAARPFFPKKIKALLDASEIQSIELCEGCGDDVNGSARSWKPSLASRSGSGRGGHRAAHLGRVLWRAWQWQSRKPQRLHGPSHQCRCGPVTVHQTDNQFTAKTQRTPRFAKDEYPMHIS
jgi:hypothetical protein